MILMENESNTLINSLSNSIENSIITNNEIESLLIDKLLIVGNSIGKRCDINNLNVKDLKRTSETGNISHISIFDKDGDFVVSIDSTSPDSGKYPAISSIFEYLNDDGYYDFGITENPLNGKEMYLLAVLSANKDKIILTGIDFQTIMKFRRRIGIGRQIQDIAKNKDIVYAALQDTIGIISAAGGVTELLPIQRDTFLLDSWESNNSKNRIIEYNSSMILEVVKPIIIEPGNLVLTRIALSLNKIQDIQQRSMRRVIIIGIGIFILGVVVFYVVMTREKFIVLKKEHEKHRKYTSSILNEMTDGVVAVSKDEKIIVFNKAARRILKPEATINIFDNYKDIFPKDELRLNISFENDENLNYFELEYYSGNDLKILGCSISLLKDENDDADTSIAIIRDLTIRKKLDEQIHRKDKLTALGELAAGVAHEIRNPLNAIHVIAQRFQLEFEPEEDKSEFKKLATTVRNEVSRVNEIIKQFLEFARPAPLKLIKSDISQILRETASLVESAAKTKNIMIYHPDLNPIVLLIDPHKMKQAILNLMQNAIDAMDNGGKLSYEAEKIDKTLQIKIKDTGNGIAKEIRSKIFNLYFTSKPHGNGLGLSIVHQIVSEHSGEISFETGNGGTEFLITLNCTDNFVD